MGRRRPLFSFSLVVAFLASLLVLLPSAPASAADTGLTLTKTAPKTALAGSPLDINLTFANSGPTDEYNIAFRDVLPVGTSYVAGSTKPASIGEPQTLTVTTAQGQRQVLIWNNVSDLPQGAKQSVSFQVSTGTASVGTPILNTADAYASSAPRTLVKFDPTTGDADQSSYTGSATSNTTTTTLSALQITKSEPSPEHELLRGVHDHATTYTLKVANTAKAATNSTVVTDYLPAQLEFLGCGTQDNTPGTTVEYPGAPRLDAIADLTTNCPTPAGVDTVTLTATQAQALGLGSAGVYTKVTWNLGTLAAGGTSTITYKAGIPQRANVAFATGTSTGGVQGANLANNTGASTREGATGAEQSLQNAASVSGTYSGPVYSGGSTAVGDATTLTVSSEDLAMQKSVSPGAFDAGGIATYTFKIEASEYDETSGITLTDNLPDGLCPLGDAGTNYSFRGPGDTACEGSAGTAPTGATIKSVTHVASGGYTIVFDPIASVAHNGVYTVTLQARMLTKYDNNDPTVDGDSFDNTADINGTTTTRTGVNPPADDPGTNGVLANVTDTSQASLSTAGPSLSKTIKPTVTPTTCPANDATTYVDNTTTPSTDPTLTFREGDRVCFKIRVNFSTTNRTKNPVLTDFLPAYATYEPGSDAKTSNDNVTASFSAANLSWTLGDNEGSSKFVNAGGVFEHVIAATITAPPVLKAAGQKPDITANLAKLRYVSTKGTVGFLRDQVDFSVAPAPPVAIGKSAVDTSNGNATVANNAIVTGGHVLKYTVKATNNGTAASGNNVPVVGPEVLDVLPAGLDCSTVSTVSDGGVCTNPGQAGHPSFNNNGTLSAIRWNLPDTAAYTIAPTASLSLTYNLTLPDTPRVGLTFVNRAGVVSFATTDNTSTTSYNQHYPASNIDTSVPAAQFDTTAANTQFTVKILDAGLTKTSTTAITETNNAAGQAVIGEGITYTVTFTVPAHTEIYNAKLTDPMPAGVVLLPPTKAEYSATGVNGTYSTSLPAGVTFDDQIGALTLPTTFANNTATDEVFRITLPARLGTDNANTQVPATAPQNIATLSNTPTTAASSTPVRSQTAQSTVSVIEPAPSLNKSDDNPTPVVGQDIHYTLAPTNAAGRPTLHDSYVVDCVPAGLVVTATPAPSQGTVTTAPAGYGCASGTTGIKWSIGDLKDTSNLSYTYTAQVNPQSAGATSYTNTATLTGSSLDNASQTPDPTERTYSASDNDTVTVTPATFAKTTTTPTRAVGQRASYTTTVKLPKGVNFYDSAVFDTLPPGLDPSTVRVEGTPTCSPGCALTATAMAPSGRNIGFSIGDVTADPNNDRTLSITYSAVVQDVAGNKDTTTLVNSAHFGWDQTDGTDKTSPTDSTDKSTDPAAAVVTVVEPALGITKVVSDPTPAPGSTFQYTVKVTNSGTSTAYGTSFTDTVPAGVVVDQTTISGGGILAGAGANGGGTITWTAPTSIGTGAANAATFTYQAKLADPAPTATLTNTARVSDYKSTVDPADGPARTYPGKSATAAVTSNLPHVTIAKSVVGGDVAYIGQPKTFQIVITSDGTSKAYKVEAADVLPANWAYVPGSSTFSVTGGGTLRGPVVTYNGAARVLTFTDVADLPVGGKVTITYQATPNAGVTTNPGVGHTVGHTNTASTTAQDVNGQTQDADGKPFNGPAATATAHVDSADVAITKTPQSGAAVAGRDFSWTLGVKNNGTDPAVGGFTVTDTMPTAMTNVSASGTGWACSVNGQNITCTRNSTGTGLASGASFPDITVTGRIPATQGSGTTLSNKATVAATTYDPASANNTATSDITVTTDADLAVKKTLSGPMTAGQIASYSLDVTNNGPSVHTGTVAVTDDVPAGTTYDSASGTGWDCSPNAGKTTITCTRNDTAPIGALPTITVKVLVDSSRTAAVVNKGVVDGYSNGTADSDKTNNASTVTTTPATSADLTILKQHRGTFTAGSNGTYRITVHNAGPSDAAGVKVTDTLPASLTYVGSTDVTGAWSCSAAGQDVTCTLTGTLVSGKDAVVDLTVKIASSSTGPISNTASVTDTTNDPNPGPNSNSSTDSTDTDSTISSDLKIEKSHPAGNVVAGDDVTYTLKVTNNGPSDSAGPITVSDTLPAGMTCKTIAGAACSGTSVPDYTRTAGLVAGDSFSITLVAHVDASVRPSTLTNTAAVTGPTGQPDPNLGNNSSDDPTVVVNSAEVSVTKAYTSPTPLRAGQTATFTITAHNAGTSSASGVKVIDTLPAGMTLDEISGSGWTCTKSPASCTLNGLLAPDVDATITVKATVASGTPDGTVLTNAADITTGTTGNTSAGDHATANTPALANRADLTLTKKRVGPADVLAGNDVSFTLDVHNNGPSDSLASIRITDTLPPGTSYVSASAPWTCTPSSGQVVTCDLAQSLVSGGDTPTLTMLVHVDADTNAGTLTNNAHVDSTTTTDDVRPNNDASADINVIRGAALKVLKTHVDPVIIGGQVTFTVTVGNDGPSTARAVTLSDPMPQGLTLVSASGTGWTCPNTGGAVTCSLNATLAPQKAADPVTVVATVGPEAYPSVTNVATAEGANAPEVTGSDLVKVPAQVDLSVSKKHVGDLQVGQQGHYQITVTNDGPTEDPATITVSDALPTGLTFVSASGDGWTCSAATNVVTCTRQGLGSKASSTIDLTVSVGAAAYPGVSNVATVSTPTQDLTPGNNSGTDNAPVRPQVALSIDKRATSVSDSTVVYALKVTSMGPNATVDPIVVTDKLPTGLSVVSAKGAGWACSDSGRTMTCLYAASMPVGASSTITLSTKLDADMKAGSTVRNTASVNGGYAPRPGHDQDSATITVPRGKAAAAAAAGGAGADGGLPGTGGPALWLLLVGLLLSVCGAAAVILGLGRRRVGGAHRAG